MSLAQWWHAFRTIRLSQPAEDRELFRATQGGDFSSVLDTALGDGSRCQRLLDWLARGTGTPKRYAAIDMFEAGGGMALKEFHAMINAAGCKAMPVPGTLASGLPRIAHTIGAVDLLILGQDVDQLQDPAFASFLPRIVHDKTVVVATDAQSDYLYQLSADELLNEVLGKSSAAA